LEIEGIVIQLLQSPDLSVTEFTQQPYIFSGIITSDLIKPHQAYTEIIFKTNRVVEAEKGSNSFGQAYIASFALSEIQIEPVTETTIANLVIQAQQRKIESTIHTQAIQDLLKETIQDEMKQLQRQNVELQHQLQQSQQQLHQTQKRIEKFKSELEQAKAEIAAMQTSKFWRIRAAWFRFKLMFTSKQI
jgi:predicted RNase H-like nuclease (RuvC/YqgF family)